MLGLKMTNMKMFIVDIIKFFNLLSLHQAMNILSSEANMVKASCQGRTTEFSMRKNRNALPGSTENAIM